MVCNECILLDVVAGAVAFGAEYGVDGKIIIETRTQNILCIIWMCVCVQCTMQYKDQPIQSTENNNEKELNIIYINAL